MNATFEARTKHCKTALLSRRWSDPLSAILRPPRKAHADTETAFRPFRKTLPGTRSRPNPQEPSLSEGECPTTKVGSRKTDLCADGDHDINSGPSAWPHN